MSNHRIRARLAGGLATALALAGLVAAPSPPAEAAPAHHRPGVEGVTKLLNWTAVGSVRLDSTWYAYAKAGEVIHATSLSAYRYPYGAPDPDRAHLPSNPQVRVRILAPSGAQLATCTADGLGESCEAAAAAAADGAFKVVWDSPNLVENGAQIYLREDLWVTANGVDRVGRVFAPTWYAEQVGYLNTLDPAVFGPHGEVDLATTYVVGDDGTVFKVDMAGFMGVSSSFQADALGVYDAGTCWPTNRSASFTGSYPMPPHAIGGAEANGCGRSFLLFPDPPADDLPAVLTAAQGWDGPVYPRYQVPATPQIVELTPTSPVDPERPYATSVKLDLGEFKGVYEVAVDVNGDGDLTDAADVVKRFQQLTPGQAVTQSWDGLDALGRPVPGDGPQPKLTVRLVRGNEYHLTLYDIEHLSGGVRIQQLAGYQVARAGGDPVWPSIHWDDTDVAARRPSGDDYRETMTTEPKLIATPAEGIEQTGAFVHGWKDPFDPTKNSGWGDLATISFNVWNDLSADADLQAGRQFKSRHLDLVAKTGRLEAPDGGVRRIAYELTLKNTGNADFTAAAPASVVDALPQHMSDWRIGAAEYSAGTPASSGQGVFADGKLTWSSPLKAGETVKVAYSGAVTPGFEPTRLNQVTAGQCPAQQADALQVIVSTCDDQPVQSTVKLPGLTVAKRVDTSGLHEAGHYADYTVTLTNVGQAAYTAADPARVTDDLSGVLDDAALAVESVRPAGAVWDADAQTLTWSGPLAAGAAQEITYRVVYDPGLAASDLRLDNTASIAPADAIDLTPGLRAATSTPGSDLHLFKTASAAEVE
ncbi:MAG: hypothetical protein LBG60_03750, partial [Bifidobacteriaceae bacterium]|nr:hypothetical protein [Bifidobacteriaceae bacterium]